MNDDKEDLLDIEIKRYCQYKLNKYNQANYTILNNTRKSHTLKFNEKVNEVITSINFKQWVIEL